MQKTIIPEPTLRLAPTTPPTFREAFLVWCRVAVLSFGGPAGQIAVMHRILVDEKKWISESRFLHALNYCMLLPGPEAQQLATYIGWLLHKSLGGLVAGLLFVLPGFLSIMVLSILYVTYHDLTLVQGIFFGLKPAVVAIVVEAIFRIGRRVLKNNAMRLMALLAFMALFLFQIPFPVVILLAGMSGLVGGKIAPNLFAVLQGHTSKVTDDIEDCVGDQNAGTQQPRLIRSLRIAATWLIIWLLPIAICYKLLGPDNVFTTEVLFFSKAAMVTFGGAYSVLAYIAEECVKTYNWLSPTQMLDGLGMAETTPGPLIQVVQFVGFMGAYNNPEGLHPLWAGVIGSILTTWVTYAPCFLWIFLGAPYIEHFRAKKALNAALSTITAAVVGVILNLSIWFALHVLFQEVQEESWGYFHWLLPVWDTIELQSLFITMIAFVLMFQLHIGMIRTLGISVLLGIVLTTLV